MAAAMIAPGTVLAKATEELQTSILERGRAESRFLRTNGTRRWFVTEQGKRLRAIIGFHSRRIAVLQSIIEVCNFAEAKGGLVALTDDDIKELNG